jgi:hypothetical protein
MEVVLTWGPDRLTPELDRLLAAHPHIDSCVAESALAECHRVMASAQDLAPALKGLGPSTTSRAEIRSRHTWLTEELLDRAIQQGLYFHWRDTGL